MQSNITLNCNLKFRYTREKVSWATDTHVNIQNHVLFLPDCLGVHDDLLEVVDGEVRVVDGAHQVGADLLGRVQLVVDGRHLHVQAGVLVLPAK